MGIYVGIHTESYRKSSAYLDKYVQILNFNKIPYVILDVNQSDFWETIEKLTHFIFRWEHYEDEKQLAEKILPVIENEYNVSCFPDQRTAWHYDDKIKQYYVMQSKGFPFTECWIFWSKQHALDWLNGAEFPVVAKLRGGAGSKNVQLIKSSKKARRIINKMFGPGRYPSAIDRNTFSIRREILHLGGNILRFLKGVPLHDTWIKEKNYVLFQKYLPHNQFDIRVTTIGNRAFAFRRLVRPNDFRASGSGKIDYDMKEIDPRCLSIAFEVSRTMNFQTMAYDFIYNENNEPEFCEISYTFLDDAIYNCPGYWDDNLVWHEGHHWPQYFQLMDQLGLPGLKERDI